MVKYGLILFIIIIQIVLVIVSAYFIFWVYSCVFTISGHLHSSVRCTFSRIHPHLFESYPDLQPQFTNSSKWSGADFIVAHSISMSFSPKRNVKMLFYFSLFLKCKKYSWISSTSHPSPMYQKRCYYFKLLKISKIIIWEKPVLFILIKK